MGSLNPQPGRSSMMHRNPLRPWTRLAQLVPACRSSVNQDDRRSLADLLGPYGDVQVLQVEPLFGRSNPTESHDRRSACRYFASSDPSSWALTASSAGSANQDRRKFRTPDNDTQIELPSELCLRSSSCGHLRGFSINEDSACLTGPGRRLAVGTGVSTLKVVRAASLSSC